MGEVIGPHDLARRRYNNITRACAKTQANLRYELQYFSVRREIRTRKKGTGPAEWMRNVRRKNTVVAGRRARTRYGERADTQ